METLITRVDSITPRSMNGTEAQRLATRENGETLTLIGKEDCVLRGKTERELQALSVPARRFARSQRSGEIHIY